MVSGSLKNVENPGWNTIALHGGQKPDPINGARAAPIHQTCSYNFEDAADGAEKFAWSKDGYVYTRMGSPTNTIFETRMTMFMALTNRCQPGHNFVSTSWLYCGTYNQFRVYTKKFEINVKFFHGDDLTDIKNLVDENTRCVYIETISNPKHNIPDVAAIAKVVHDAGIPLIIDKTLGMGGYISRPISLGADIVTNSCTKWIGGHGTSMGGIVIDGGHFDWSASGKFPEFTKPADGYHGMRFWETYGNKTLAAKLRMDSMRDRGPSMSPFNAWLFLQGLETLPLLGKRHVENSQAFAEWLEAHPLKVWEQRGNVDWGNTYSIFASVSSPILNSA